MKLIYNFSKVGALLAVLFVALLSKAESFNSLSTEGFDDLQTGGISALSTSKVPQSQEIIQNFHDLSCPNFSYDYSKTSNEIGVSNSVVFRLCVNLKTQLSKNLWTLPFQDLLKQFLFPFYSFW